MLMNNPGISVDLYPFDLFAHTSPISAEQAIEGSDLVIASTDKTEIQLAINALAWRKGIPAIFGGCYEFCSRWRSALYTS